MSQKDLKNRFIWVQDHQRLPEQSEYDVTDQVSADLVNRFLNELNLHVNEDTVEYDFLLQVLWLCYLGPDQMDSSAVAFELGVAESTVNDYRLTIEEKLRALTSFGELDEAVQFERALRQRLKAKLSYDEGDIVTAAIPHEQYQKLRAKAKDIITSMAVTRVVIAHDQEEIERLKLETRETLTRLNAA